MHQLTQKHTETRKKLYNSFLFFAENKSSFTSVREAKYSGLYIRFKEILSTVEQNYFNGVVVH